MDMLNLPLICQDDNYASSVSAFPHLKMRFVKSLFLLTVLRVSDGKLVCVIFPATKLQLICCYDLLIYQVLFSFKLSHLNGKVKPSIEEDLPS